MDLARVAQLLRELATELEAEGATERPRRARAKRMPVRPAREIDDVTRARVRRILREKGYRDA